MRMPPFAKFFSEQAELKREHAKQFLRYLRKREGIICLPVIKRPNIDNWGNGLQALKFAVQLENTLTNVLQDLKITATKDDETGLIDFVKEFIDKQTASIAFLEYHQKLLEESLQQKGLSEKSAESAETSVEET
ncbi:soma ferritin-like [Pongo pygmaeus]|uniref:Ferritin n=1 Tax=Pongo abelii TaxID=9601 RepID=A0A8I5U3W2_PONAB|nr:soma ferritin-like [Pongo pygmaeus]XP_054407170.1 soma ferritin-like [Pongo abelii]